MRSILAVSGSAFLIAVTAAPAWTQEPEPLHPTVASAADYRLVWSDEFESAGLPDSARWTYDTHANATGWYNNERQYYAADRLQNARVNNSQLIIEARRETLDADDSNNQAYTSARLVSRDSWTYGFYEIRAQLPCGRGTWPAIWMLPRDLNDWPLDGEIDIMEHVGHRPGVVHATVHTGAYNHVAGTHKGQETTVQNACDAFHRYQALWTSDAVTFLVDDVAVFRFDNDGRGDRATWPFDRPFQLILNIAIGGDWGGAEGIDDTAFPQMMQVDYVRVFQPEPDQAGSD